MGTEKNIGAADVKEWLQRARGIRMEIRAYETAIREKRERYERIIPPIPDGLPHDTTVAHKQDRLLELEECMREKAEELCSVEREITDAIWLLKSTKQRTVLFSYYVRCMTLEQIAEEMDCSARNVQNLRMRGIFALDNQLLYHVDRTY